MEFPQYNLIYSSLYPKQQQFRMTPAIYRLYGGQKGGGKSKAMRAECVGQCLSAPDIRGLVLRRTFPEVRENMIVPMQKELPAQTTGYYRYNVNDGIFTFYNGSTIRFSYCRNLQDVLNYQGLEYDFICIEELTHWREEEWQILMGCLRTTRAGIIPNFFASTNPWGIGHAWVKRLWIDRDFKEDEKPEDYAFIPASVYDNTILLETQPNYLDRLKALPEKLRRAYLEGDWTVFDGQFFGEFREDIHTVEPYLPIVGVKKRIVALDYGFTNPSACYWMALLNTGRVVVYRELYITGLTYEKLGEKLREMTTEIEWRDMQCAVVDPAILAKPSETTGTSGKEEFLKGWKHKVVGGDNARVSGAQLYRKMLQPYEDPNTGNLTALVEIGKNCKDLIRTLPTLLHDKVNVEDIDTKQEDHAYDGTRYGFKFLMSDIGSLAEVSQVNEKLTKSSEKVVQNSPKSVQSQKSQVLQKRLPSSGGILGAQF